jgi:hypothetical protein
VSEPVQKGAGGEMGVKSSFLKIDSLNLGNSFAQRSILLGLLFYLSPIVKIRDLTPESSFCPLSGLKILLNTLTHSVQRQRFSPVA